MDEVQGFCRGSRSQRRGSEPALAPLTRLPPPPPPPKLPLEMHAVTHVLFPPNCVFLSVQMTHTHVLSFLISFGLHTYGQASQPGAALRPQDKHRGKSFPSRPVPSASSC